MNVDDTYDEELMYEWDMDNPNMIVGTCNPSMFEFRLAIMQHNAMHRRPANERSPANYDHVGKHMLVIIAFRCFQRMQPLSVKQQSDGYNHEALKIHSHQHHRHCSFVYHTNTGNAYIQEQRNMVSRVCPRHTLHAQ